MKKPVVRVYDSRYQKQVEDLILSIQQQEYAIPITIEDQPDLHSIPSFYQTGNGNFWIALDGEQVVGTISLLDIGDSHLALRKMFVAKPYRGSTFRTAHELLSTAINWANQREVSAIYLGTTPAFKAAHRFYEKNGFTSIPPDALPSRFPVLEVDKKFYHYVLNKKAKTPITNDKENLASRP
ncbi:GNAT family N-acetyltransferase [Alteribacter aurantiacus]|uniref:GNAT family N-acetyltransferase n=1 Tax=Alteribacter aurantiacus TaxID=254410 RepID=UPI000406004E|nr:GNAT family N-acetyltransferase [Alteribacter aurantiacus]